MLLAEDHDDDQVPDPIETTIQVARDANDVLQSGVAGLASTSAALPSLQRYEHGLVDIGIADALSLALASSERLMTYLHRLASQLQRRPDRAWSMDDLSAPTRVRAEPTCCPGPQEIVETLTACETLARRCRGQYDAGLGEDTMQDLEVMLQRLEFASRGVPRGHGPASPAARPPTRSPGHAGAAEGRLLEPLG